MPRVAGHRRQHAHLALALALGPVEGHGDLGDLGAQARELDQQLGLAGEAALADQRRRRARRSPRAASTRGRRGRTTTPCWRSGRRRGGSRDDAAFDRKRRCARDVGQLAAGVVGGEHDVGALGGRRTSCASSASRSLVVSDSIVMIRSSSPAMLQRAAEAGVERAARALVLDPARAPRAAAPRPAARGDLDRARRTSRRRRG